MFGATNLPQPRKFYTTTGCDGSDIQTFSLGGPVRVAVEGPYSSSERPVRQLGRARLLCLLPSKGQVFLLWLIQNTFYFCLVDRNQYYLVSVDWTATAWSVHSYCTGPPRLPYGPFMATRMSPPRLPIRALHGYLYEPSTATRTGPPRLPVWALNGYPYEPSTATGV